MLLTLRFSTLSTDSPKKHVAVHYEESPNKRSRRRQRNVSKKRKGMAKHGPYGRVITAATFKRFFDGCSKITTSSTHMHRQRDLRVPHSWKDEVETSNDS